MPWKTTKVDDSRILSLVKKKKFTTLQQTGKNALEKVDVSKSIIKRRFHQCKYKEFTTRWKLLGTFKNMKDRPN